MILEGGQMGEMVGGYFIRRFVSPQVKLRILSSTKKKVAGPTPGGNSTENLISPTASRVAARDSAAKQRKSPLPDWYPRTPLRDITVLCKAIERMNMRASMAPQQVGDLAKKASPAQIEHQTPVPTNRILSSHMQPIKPEPTVLDFTPVKVVRTPEVEAYEKKLTESIEKLEKIVKRSMKREKQRQGTSARVSRRNDRYKMLISMR